MRNNLGYAWRTCNVRPRHSNRKDVILNRAIFHKFMELALENNVQFTYIDEMSVCTRHLSFRSWIHKENPVHIIAPPSSQSISVIGSITEDGHFDCVLRKGTNRENEILQFLIDLDEKFQARYGADYRDFRKRNVIIMDNAAYHKTEIISRFAKKQGIQMLTLPQYTPEWNPIEIVWSWVKRNLSKMNMNSR